MGNTPDECERRKEQCAKPADGSIMQHTEPAGAEKRQQRTDLAGPNHDAWRPHPRRTVP